ncbi:MAG: hypothetical protein V7L23_31670 [Nostoc sp.]|uniref:hypothetical protein n=1 Tax=Nostoc sp. TaxID=1180 RepID=UPI002FF40E82
MTLNWTKLPKPWTREQCRRRYVEGGDDIGLRALAGTSGRDKSTLERWCSKDEWVSQRGQHQGKMQVITRQKTIEKTSDKLSDELSEIAIANYQRHKLARDYAAKIIDIKARQLAEIDKLPLAEKAVMLSSHHIGYEMNYWSQILKRSTDAIESATGLRYYTEINAAAGRLEKEGYEIVDPTEEMT